MHNVSVGLRDSLKHRGAAIGASMQMVNDVLRLSVMCYMDGVGTEHFHSLTGRIPEQRGGRDWTVVVFSLSVHIPGH